MIITVIGSFTLICTVCGVLNILRYLRDSTTQIKSSDYDVRKINPENPQNIIQTLMGFQLPASKANLNDICLSYVAHALSIANTLGSITGFVAPANAGELLNSYGNNHITWGIIWSISGASFH